MPDESIEDLKAALLQKEPPTTAIPSENLLKTGSVELDLAISGKTAGGWAKGLYYSIIGDSDSGKSWMLMTAMAEASINPEFNNYRFILDQTELGVHMDVAGYFGEKLAKRLGPPQGTQEEPQYSSTLEELYDNIEEAVDKGPCIYIVDSMDPLETTEERLNEELKKAHRQGKGKKAKGSMGAEKSKANSRKLRVVCNKIAANGSILFIVSQTRQNMGFGAQFNPRTRSGGDALKFYARVEMWLSVRERLRDTKYKNRQIGQVTKIKISKNHISGWMGNIFITYLKGHGIDTVGDAVAFLAEHHWAVKSKGIIEAAEFEFKGTKEAIVGMIQEKNKEAKLRKIAGQVWRKIEKQIRIKRKSRYTA